MTLPHGRHVLSDADDNSSFFDEATLIDTGRRTDAVVYAVLPDPGGVRRNPIREKLLKDRLSALTTLTGGRVIAVDKDVTTAFLNALEEFRKSYVVAYTATNVKHGGWHELKVTVPPNRQYGPFGKTSVVVLKTTGPNPKRIRIPVKGAGMSR